MGKYPYLRWEREALPWEKKFLPLAAESSSLARALVEVSRETLFSLSLEERKALRDGYNSIGWRRLFAINFGAYLALLSTLKLRTFEEVCTSPRVVEFLLFSHRLLYDLPMVGPPTKGEMEQASKAMVQGLRQAFFTWSLRGLGDHVYDVSLGLGQRLKGAKISGLTSPECRLPFPVIYISVPDNLFNVWNDETGWHKMHGIFVSEEEVIRNGNPIRSWLVLMLGEDKGDLGDALVWLSLFFEKESLDESIEATMDSAKAMNSPLFETFGSTTRDIFRFIVAVVLYSTWPKAEFERTWLDPRVAELWERARSARRPRQREKARKELDGRTPRSVIKLGRSIEVVSPGSNGSGQKLAYHQRVSAHFQRYWEGSGETRKAVWKYKEVYSRGDDSLPILSKPHAL